MNQALIVYWSGTGNTKKMAELIQKGILESGNSAECKEVSSMNAEELDSYSLVVMGCPSMGDEVLEENEMEPFVKQSENHIKNKKLALFGSYGWGSGEWMEEWQERMASKGANMLFENGLIVMEEPNGTAADECVTYGKNIGEHITL